MKPQNEIWKNIKGYESLYLVSSFGRIKSLPKKTRKGERILSIHNGKDYYIIDLVKDRKVKKYLIHRLVAEAFIENPEDKPQVNHINGNKHDNRIENLEWSTRSENQLHSIRTGLRTTRGVKNSQSKLTEENVLNIFSDNRTYKEISQLYEISVPTVCDIKRGYSWTHITGMKNIKKNRSTIETSLLT